MFIEDAKVNALIYSGNTVIFYSQVENVRENPMLSGQHSQSLTPCSSCAFRLEIFFSTAMQLLHVTRISMYIGRGGSRGGGRRRPDPPSNFPNVPFSQEDLFLLGLTKS